MISKGKYKLATGILFLTGLFIHIQSSAQTTFFSDQCDDTTPWTLGAGTPGPTYGEYTAWKIGNVGNNVGSTIDGSCLAINAWGKINNGIWLAEYVETAATDIIAKRTINAASYQTLQLQFDWICRGENVGSTIYDYGQVGYSTNGGSTFTWLTTGGTGNGGKYYGNASIVRNQTVALPTALNNTSFVLGFRWINNATNGNFPGFTIDNIRVNGLLIGGGTPESSKVTVLLDECKNDQGWTFSKGPLFDGSMYTAWTIGNDTLCTIDYGTLGIETFTGTQWTCGYLDFMTMDLVASKKVDARNYENMELQFDWSGVGESNPYYLFDYGQVGYSLNNGASFTWFTTGGADAQGRYFACPTIQRGQKLTLPTALNGKEFLLAFRWVNDGSVGSVPAFIVDNIKISGSAKATQLVSIFKDNFDSQVAWDLKRANPDPSGNTLGWNIDRRCTIDGSSLSINLYNNTTKQWDCGFATTSAANLIASRLVSAANAKNLALKFDWKVSSTTTTDYGQIGYSTDGGATYTWLNYGGTGNTGKYYNQLGLVRAATVKLPSSLDGKDFKLGIRWINDAATNSGTAMIIDNINIVAETSTGIPPSAELQKVMRTTYESVQVAGKKTEADVDALTETGKIVQKDYFDGMNKPIQQVLWKASPSKNDIVNVMLYDENANANIEFLPYVGTTTDAGYHSDMLVEQYTYNNTAKPNFTPTEYGFSRNITERSPANRIIELGSVGKEFQPDATTLRKTVAQKIYTAIDNNPPTTVEAIKIIKLAAGPTLTVDYYSAPSENLFVTEIIDADKKVKKKYKNNKGQLILERNYAANTTTILSQTYYVYDQFDRLRVVIQPEGLTASKITTIPTTLSGSFLDDYCFQYNYDERGRVIAKKVPGAGWMEFAYDRWDRQVASQDAAQKAKSPQEFSYIKYDYQNRPIATGTFKATSRTLTIAIVRTELANVSLGARCERRTLGTLPNMDFTNNLTYPKADATNSLTVLTQTYYDDYKYTDLTGFSFTPYGTYTATSPVSGLIGAITAVRSNVLGTSTWLTTVSYFDQYSRIIQVQQTNINAVKNFLTTEYDFQGRITKTIEDNKLVSGTGVLVENTNQYDHMGRLTRISNKVNNAASATILADYKYTDLGARISERNMYSVNGGTSYLQSVDYTFNEKGWISAINNSTLTNDGTLNNDATDIFGMEFRYYKNQVIDNTKALYNGNISEIIWNNKNDNKRQGYLHSYDDLNRITAASYRNLTTTSENNRFSLNTVTYDASGNIKTLQQNGLITGTTTFGLMDNLTYLYVGNRLTGVSDAVGATSYSYDFQNGTNDPFAVDYDYDEKGNITYDDNKGMSVTYNLFNLPVQITMANGKKTIFTYDAFGTKLRKQEYNGATLTLTNDYVGSVQYLNGAVQFAHTAEGRVFNNAGVYRYDYFMRDHTNNVRMVYTANGSAVQILQKDDYYPMGNTFNSYLLSGGKNTNLFNSMEFLENDVSAYDFNARMYNSQLGRTFQPDPAADMYAYKTPYSFLANNPVMVTDPTGMYDNPADAEGGGGGGGGSVTDKWFTDKWNYRGGDGFFAAFTGGGGRTLSGSGGMRVVAMLVERYKDWYFYSDYTGMRFSDTKLEARYWTLGYVMQERFPNGELLLGVNFWQPSTSSWNNGDPAWTIPNDPNKSIGMNNIYTAGVSFLINTDGLPPSNPLMQAADGDYSQRNFLGNNIDFPINQAGSFVNNFNELVDKNALNPNFTYFRFIIHLDANKNPVYRYGVIPALIGTPQ